MEKKSAVSSEYRYLIPVTFLIVFFFLFGYRPVTCWLKRLDPGPKDPLNPNPIRIQIRIQIRIHNAAFFLVYQISEILEVDLQASPYHAGLSPPLRSQTQDQWIQA